MMNYLFRDVFREYKLISVDELQTILLNSSSHGLINGNFFNVAIMQEIY